MTDEELLEFCKKLRLEYPNGFMRIEEGDRTKAYPLRESPIIMRDRFKKLSRYLGFTLGEDFTEDEAVEATRLYVKSFGGSTSGMRQLKYFIFKKEHDRTDGTVNYISDLMTAIWNVRDGLPIEDYNSGVDWTTNVV